MTNTLPKHIDISFSHIDSWIFDLDNTLYAPELNLWGQIDVRMRDYIALRLNLPKDKAFQLQKQYYRDYGTSLRGLMIEHDFNPDDFLNYVHDIDHSELHPNDHLIDALHALSGRKYIFTNGSTKHAQNVLHHLGLNDVFDDIFDIVAADFTPKPHYETYAQFLKKHEIAAETAVMFEDLPRNLEVPAALGMTSVLLVPNQASQIKREAWEHEGRDHPHIDYVTHDLAGFLQSVIKG